MDELIAALIIFRKYSDKAYPTGCDHDILRVYVSPELVSEEDMKQLDEYGFHADREDLDCFYSFKYGSA